MKRCIILGASSGIGREVALLLLKEGWKIGIGARRIDKLNEIKELAPNNVFVQEIDVNANDAIQNLDNLIRQMGEMDLFFYSVGIGWQNPNLEEEKELKTIQTNAMAFTRIIGHAFRYFEARKQGHIACVSSIAGTKGLGPAPAYSATKALQNTYFQALEQMARKKKLNIILTDIKPGFVDTELLNGTSFPMLMKSSAVADKIVNALKAQRHTIIIDWRWRIITSLWKLIPNYLWRKLPL